MLLCDSDAAVWSGGPGASRRTIALPGVSTIDKRLPVVEKEVKANPKLQAASDQVIKAVSLTVAEKDFIPADPGSNRYQAYLSLKCSYSNTAAKDIRAFTGTIVFQDLFGKEVYKVGITISDPIKAGAQGSWNGTVNFNQFNDAQQRFRAANLQDMKVIWVPSSILFADGTRTGEATPN